MSGFIRCYHVGCIYNSVMSYRVNDKKGLESSYGLCRRNKEGDKITVMGDCRCHSGEPHIIKTTPFILAIGIMDRMNESEDIPNLINSYWCSIRNRLNLYGLNVSVEEMKAILRYGIDVYSKINVD